jgi:hypothetical protein
MTSIHGDGAGITVPIETAIAAPTVIARSSIIEGRRGVGAPAYAVATRSTIDATSQGVPAASSAAHPRVGPGLIARDGAAAAAHGQQALVGEPAIRPRDRVPVHAEVSGELPHGGQVLAGADAPLGNRLAQADSDLVLERAGTVH